MLIPRKGKGQLEIYKYKLGIHDWVTEHWWETRQKPRRAIFSHKGGRDILDEFSINCLLYEYNLGKPRSILKKKFGVSDSSITRIINTHGKPRFGNYKFKDIYPSVIKDYQNGMKVKDICDKYSIGHTTINNYLRRFNIPRHT
jgi:Mor family transcriptional regulator